MTESHNCVSSRSGGFSNRLAIFVVGCGALFLIVISIPYFQQARSRRPGQAEFHLRQIRDALLTYSEVHVTFPFDSRGPDFALYRLSMHLPAACFNSHPHQKPRPQAQWNHVEQRLVESDFEYLNLPGVGRSPRGRIIMAEKVDTSERSIRLLQSDGLITSYAAFSNASQDVIGSWTTADQFLIKDDELLRIWEGIALPQGPEHSTHVSASDAESPSSYLMTTRRVGDVSVYYEYDRGRLRRRVFESPNATVVDLVSTDHIGRITELKREPANWRTVWRIKPGE